MDIQDLPPLIDGCRLAVCGAEGPDADHVKTAYGIRKLNSDPAREIRLDADGDLVVWQVDATASTADRPNSDVFGVNTATDEVVAIGWPTYFQDTQFLVSGSHVVFLRAGDGDVPVQDDPGGVVLMEWNQARGTPQVIDLAMDKYGSPWVLGVDWPLVLYRWNEEVDGGLYVINAESGQKWEVYRFETESPSEKLGPSTLFDGRVYYVINPTVEWRSDLRERELETGVDRIVAPMEGWLGDGLMTTTAAEIVWTAGDIRNTLALWAYKPGAAVAERITQSPDKPSFDSDGKGDWIVFFSRGAADGDDAIVGIHMPTRERHVLFTEERGLHLQLAATNGSQAYFQLLRAPVTDGDSQWDIYSMPLPN